MGFAQKDSEIKSLKVTTFANSPPNQISHCPQWGLDRKVREGSATSSMCSWQKVILILGRLRCSSGVVTTAAAASKSREAAWADSIGGGTEEA